MKTLVRKNFAVIILALIAVFSFLMFSETGKVYADELEIVPVVIEEANFAMVDGASVRVQDIEDEKTNGLRFASTLSKTDYKGIMVNTNYSDIEFGVFIMPYDYIAEYGDLTKENLFGSQTKEAVYDWALWTENGWNYSGNKVRIINIYSNQMKESAVDGNYYLNASITGLFEENIARDFVSVGYIKYTEGGVVKYEMADYVGNNQRNSVRSMAYVAQKAIAYNGVDACDKDQKDYLAENYIAKSVVDNTAKDFGYVDKSATSENYTFNLPENVTALRVTMNDAEYSEVPFTCENGVLSIAKSVVEAGIAEGYLESGENVVYIHTIDESREYPVYKVQEECLVVADVVLAQEDAANLKTIIESNIDKYIILGEDITVGTITASICTDTNGYFKGTIDGRGHAFKNIVLSNNITSFLMRVAGTVKNLSAEVKGTTKTRSMSGFIGRIGDNTEDVSSANAGYVENVYVKYDNRIYQEGYYNLGVVVGVIYKGTVSNCVGELVGEIEGSPNKTDYYQRFGSVVGSSLAKNSIKNCYGISRIAPAYNGKANTVLYNCELTVRAPIDSYLYVGSTRWDRFFEGYTDGSAVNNQGTVPAVIMNSDDGWSKFWMLDTENKVLKMGDNVVVSAPKA